MKGSNLLEDFKMSLDVYGNQNMSTERAEVMIRLASLEIGGQAISLAGYRRESCN